MYKKICYLCEVLFLPLDYDMKKFVFSIIALVSATVLSYAQTIDEKVGAMMNGGKWFELREFLNTNTDSINPFLDLYGKAMVAHFFNQPEMAVEYYSSLLNNQQIDLGNVVSIGLLMSSDISKLGDNGSAAKTLEAIDASIRPYYEYLDSAIIAAIGTDIAKYKALSSYKVNDLKPFGAIATIPFDIVAVGADSTKQELINVSGFINGHDCEMTFDTGAGVNVISDSMAIAMGVDIMDVDLVAGGIGVQSAKLAVAKEMTIGEITIYNVPFYVMTILSGNDEADQYLNHLQIVIGRNVMETIQNFTIDFAGKSIIVKTESDIPAAIEPNLCLSNEGIYKLRCNTVDGKSILLNPDTGDTSYGILNADMLSIIKDRCSLELASKNIRMAGAGGVAERQYYEVTDFPLSIAGVSTVVPQIPLLVNSVNDCSGYDGRIGLATFMLFDTVSFDLSRMIMYPRKN